MEEQKAISKIHHAYLVRKKMGMTLMAIAIFTVAIIYFSPVLYMFLSSFKTEYQAVYPSLIFKPTLNTIRKVLSNSDMYVYLKNSAFQVVASTVLCLLLGIPASFALVFGKFRRRGTNDKIYLWFITTILLPPVAVIIPLYIWYQKFGLINSSWGLLMAYVGFHTPIVVWMLHSFFSDIPEEIIEAAQIDGCSRLRQLTSIALPLVRLGIISAGLLVAVFVWNEFFLAFNLTGNATATLPVYMARFREQQGMFVAQLSASSTIAVLPAIILGWLTQKALIKGLTLGAVKG